MFPVDGDEGNVRCFSVVNCCIPQWKGSRVLRHGLPTSQSSYLDWCEVVTVACAFTDGMAYFFTHYMVYLINSHDFALHSFDKNNSSRWEILRNFLLHQ